MIGGVKSLMGKMDNKISGMREDIQNQSTRLVQKIIEDPTYPKYKIGG